jgi:hypothetical protein
VTRQKWDAIAPRLNCKTGTLLRELTANDNTSSGESTKGYGC